LDSQKHRFHQIDLLKQTILNHDAFYENDDLRIFPISQAELWKEGYNEEEGVFAGAKWGKYLRAPKIFFTLLQKGKGKLVPLKDIAKIRRGFTTGANEFFYLTEEQIERKRIEKEFWMHKDENGIWTPNYVIKSPRECKAIVINPKKLKYRVLMIHKDKSRLKGKIILHHIARGEGKKFNKRPTGTSRKRWYDLGTRKPYSIIWPQLFNDAFKIFLNKDQVLSDCVLMDVQIESAEVMALSLNSTYIVIFIELFGRVGLGEGALKMQVDEMGGFPVLNPSIFPPHIKQKLLEIGTDLFNRNIGSVYEEIGANKSLIMGDILGLTDEEQLEVYRSVVDLVRSRLDKAKSLKNETGEDQGELDLETDSMLSEFKNSGKGS
jgi:hypothetical protein